MSLLSIMACAQEDYRERINLDWSGNELAISPEGLIALDTDKAIYVTDAPEKGWREIPMPNNLPIYNSIKDLCWSSENIVIASMNGKLYAWEKADDVTFMPLAMSNAPKANNLRSDGHGRVWAWGLNTTVFYSCDSGRSWSEVAHIQELENLDDESRLLTHEINDLYVDNDGNRGLIGTSVNELFLTLDNCKTLQRIPTPLDQNAYQQDEASHKKPIINKVRILGDHYIVEQDNRAFITSASGIQWKPIETGTVNYIDVKGNRLIVMPDAGTVRLLDEKLNLVNEFQVPKKKQSIALGDDLYIIDETSLHKCGIKGNQRYELLRTDQEIDPMHADEKSDIFSIDGQKFYFDNYDLIAKSKATGKWYRCMTFDFKPFKPFVDKGKAFFYSYSSIDDENTLYQLNIKKRTIKPFEWPSEMFGHKKVESMQVICQVTGCYANSGINKYYKLQGDELVWVKDYTIGKERMNAYSDLPKRFKASDIQRLVGLIDETRSHPQAYPDTLITDEDRAEYIKFIDELYEDDDFQNTEFNKLSKEYHDIFKVFEMMDKNKNDNWIAPGQQITALSESYLKQAGKDASRTASTGAMTYKIVFTFKDGSSMSCHYVKWAGQKKVGYLYTPWTIAYGNQVTRNTGYEYKTEDLNVGSLINQITQGKMLDQRYCSKAHAIWQMVEQINRQQVQ